MANQFYIREIVNQTGVNIFTNLIDNFTKGQSFFEVNPNTILYSLAVDELIVNNFVERNQIPDWFCGYINLNENLSYLSKEEQDVTNFLNTNFTLATSIEGFLIDPVRFNYDKCLEYGVPGSYSYSNCIESILREDLGQGAIDFATNMNYIDETIKGILSELEEAVFEEVETQIGISQAALSDTAVAGGAARDGLIKKIDGEGKNQWRIRVPGQYGSKGNGPLKEGGSITVRSNKESGPAYTASWYSWDTDVTPNRPSYKMDITIQLTFPVHVLWGAQNGFKGTTLEYAKEGWNVNPPAVRGQQL